MTDNEKVIWKTAITSVLIEYKLWDPKRNSDKYYVSYDAVLMPAKVVYARAQKYVMEYHPEVEIPNRMPGGTPTNKFLEELGFTITEVLGYNQTEKKEFLYYYQNKIQLKEVFKSFVQFGNEFLDSAKIEPYKIRMAITNKGVLATVLGMRASYTYFETDGYAQIGFLIGNEFYNNIAKDELYATVYDFKGAPEQKLVELRVKNWNEIDVSILEECERQFMILYDVVKASKFTSWNVEAKTTNSTLKYLMFNNIEVEEFIKDESNQFNSYKEAFRKWLNNKMPSDSGTKTSYIRAIELLKRPLGYDVFTVNDINKLELLYEDLIKDQRNKDGIFYNADSSSYGQKGFYSASVKKYIEFLKEQNSDKIGKERKYYDQSYFDFNGLEKYRMKVDKSYDSKSEEAAWFYDTREKLYYLVKLLSEEIGEKFDIVYKEKPNGQRGPGLIGFKDYVLAGYAPYEFNIGDDLFIKVAISNLKKSPVFDINIDLNYRKGESQFASRRNTIFQSSYQEWLIDDNFPKNWNALLKLISPEVKELVKVYKNYILNDKLNSRLLMKNGFPLNQILYGPPGTGKTYKTKEISVQIADPNFNINNLNSKTDQRKQISKRFEELIGEGQIVFTTFHQSYGYEDFIEGIKPETIDGAVHYEVKPGIFKNLCEKAQLIDNNDIDKAISAFQNDIEENGPHDLYTSRKHKFSVDFQGGTTFRINPDSSQKKDPQYPASIEYIKRLYMGKDTTGMYNPSYVKSILEHLKSNYGLKEFEELNENVSKDYVLIIDEINRGNVSSIFGELITQLEDDKRKGKQEYIEVKLPYSKDSFGVPANVFIIGTMNTADRSVETLDTALRRRFLFEEIMPNPSLLRDIVFDGFDIAEVLSTINDRVEVLLDRDHTIGHSYFINLESGDTSKLKSIFVNNIIPLLQEYFYHDYEKIALILGEGFVQPNKQKVNFAKFKEIDIPDSETKYQLRTQINDIEKAVCILLNRDEEDQ